MSPAFERRLARIDKAFDRIRHGRDAEESRLGLAAFYFKCAIVDLVMREHGPEAAMWVLGDPEPPELRAAQKIGFTTEAQRH
jgi:hypothetical protein